MFLVPVGYIGYVYWDKHHRGQRPAGSHDARSFLGPLHPKESDVPNLSDQHAPRTEQQHDKGETPPPQPRPSFRDILNEKQELFKERLLQLSNANNKDDDTQRQVANAMISRVIAPAATEALQTGSTEKNECSKDADSKSVTSITSSSSSSSDWDDDNDQSNHPANQHPENGGRESYTPSMPIMVGLEHEPPAVEEEEEIIFGEEDGEEEEKGVVVADREGRNPDTEPVTSLMRITDVYRSSVSSAYLFIATAHTHTQRAKAAGCNL